MKVMNCTLACTLLRSPVWAVLNDRKLMNWWGGNSEIYRNGQFLRRMYLSKPVFRAIFQHPKWQTRVHFLTTPIRREPHGISINQTSLLTASLTFPWDGRPSSSRMSRTHQRKSNIWSPSPRAFCLSLSSLSQSVCARSRYQISDIFPSVCLLLSVARAAASD